MIILRDIELRRGSKLLLSDAALTIQPGQRIALIGANGCGKTSLLTLLLGELAADAGEIEGLDNLRLAHMAQEVETSELAASEYVWRGDTQLARLSDQLQLAEAAEDFEAAAALHSQLEAIDGYDGQRRAELLLNGLGFAVDQVHRPVSAFSGGWRIRLNLARALMAPSDLLLLDEPTNHLDLDASLWLQQWLQQYSGTLLMISHDRDFIDSTCDRIVHIEGRTLASYRGNYSQFEVQRAERIAATQAAYEKQQRRIAEIDDFVRRFRYKASKAKQAQSRLKELGRMRATAPAHFDSGFDFSIPAPERSSDPLLQLGQARLGYGGSAVLQGVDLILRPGSRIGLLGRNGAGKSTLLKSLVGQLPLLQGDRVPGEYCQIGYFDQQQTEALDLDASPLLLLQRLRPDAREQEILNFLGGFGFRGDTTGAAVRPLSGGEKARLALAMVVWQRPNLLVLDEPTNHLDLEMRHAIELALQDYPGAVVLVSHDRHLLRNTVDELWLVHDGRIEEYDGDLAAYESWLAARFTVATPTTSERSTEPSKKAQRQQAAAQRERLRPLKQAIASTERAMEQAQAGLGELRELLGDTGLYSDQRKSELATLLAQEGDLRQQLDQHEEQWLTLQTELEQLSAELHPD